MGTYKMIYDFAAKAGALEGYVYPKDKVDPGYLPAWVDHVVEGYQALPAEAKAEFQDLCDEMAAGLPVTGRIPALQRNREHQSI